LKEKATPSFVFFLELPWRPQDDLRPRARPSWATTFVCLPRHGEQVPSHLPLHPPPNHLPHELHGPPMVFFTIDGVSSLQPKHDTSNT
jgi:hypothetical protein